MSKVSIITAISVCCILVATGWTIWARNSTHQSDVIAVARPDFGPNAHVLLPNLNDARVVAPDRPHDPSEVFSEDKHRQIKRTRTFTVSTNSLGLRGPELETPKQGTRILCLGDSVTFGWGVEHEFAYPTLLAAGVDAEVVNAGVPALKPEHLVGYSRSLADTVQPDVVLVAMRPNWMVPQSAVGDFERIISELQTVFNTRSLGVILPPLSSFDPRGRAQNSTELRQLKQRLRVPLLDLTPAFDAQMPSTGVQLRSNGTEQLVLSRSNNAVLLRAATPSPGPGKSALAPEITQLFEQDHSVKEPYFFDGGHPDAEGFELFAKEVKAWIILQQWAKPRTEQN